MQTKKCECAENSMDLIKGLVYMKDNYNNRMEKLEQIFLILFLVFAVSISCTLLLVYYHENNKVNKYSRTDFNEGKIIDVRYNLESISSDQSGNSTIVGWFVLPDVTYVFYNYGNDVNGNGVYNYLHVCLVNDDDVYVLPTKLEGRADVTDTIGDGIDYKYAGFQARLPYRYSSLLNECHVAFLTQDPGGAKTLYIQE